VVNVGDDGDVADVLHGGKNVRLERNRRVVSAGWTAGWTRGIANMPAFLLWATEKAATEGIVT
jgi:hypothetical protein